MNNTYIMLAIAIMSIVTAMLRFAPFGLFKKKTPKIILYLGTVLPQAIMAMLVIYCLKDVSFISGSHGIPEIISLAVVGFFHLWKHQTLLSIALGTFCYMVLIQL